MNDHTCDDALNELYRFIDGELDEATRVRIEVHLNNCSPCLEAFDFEADLRKVVAQRCQERVPDQLRERIVAALDACDPSDRSDADAATDPVVDDA